MSESRAIQEDQQQARDQAAQKQQDAPPLKRTDSAPKEASRIPEAGYSDLLANLRDGLRRQDPMTVDLAAKIGAAVPEMSEKRLGEVLGLKTVEQTRAVTDLVWKRGFVPDNPKQLYMDYAGRVGTEDNLARREMADQVAAMRGGGDTYLGNTLRVYTLARGGTAGDMQKWGQLGDNVEAGAAVVGAVRGAGARGGEHKAVEREKYEDVSKEVPKKEPGELGRKPAGEAKPLESSNARRYAFGDNPRMHKDEFSGEEYPVTGARDKRVGANTYDRASVAESVDYTTQLAARKVGLQQPGPVNMGGPDSVVYDPKRDIIEVRDSKLRGPYSSFPREPSRADVLAKWGDEVNRAVNGSPGETNGGVRTGDAVLDQKIRDAWANGRWEYVQTNVRGPALPPKGPYHDLGP